MNSMMVWVVKRGHLPWSRFTEPHIRYYCERHNYNLVFVDADNEAGITPHWTKLRVFHHSTAAFVLLLDLDIFPLPHAPPIHKDFCFSVLNLAEDLPYQTEYLRAHERRLGLPKDSMRFNTGVVGAPRSCAAFFDEVYAQRRTETLFWEQGAVNLALFHNPTREVNVLPRKWNWIVNDAPTLKDLVNAGAYFLHIPGPDKEANAAHFDSEIRSLFPGCVPTPAGCS